MGCINGLPFLGIYLAEIVRPPIADPILAVFAQFLLAAGPETSQAVTL